MKKIAYFITKSNWGGAQKYVFDLSKEMKNKYEVAVAVGGRGELFTKLEENGIEVFGLNYLKNTLNPVTLTYSIFENIKVIRNMKPDIVHNNSSFSGLSIGIACFLVKQKSVFTVHGWPQNENRSFVWKIILGQCMALVVFMHTKTICVSKKVLEQTPKLLGLFDLKKKCELVYNGIDEKMDFADAPESFNINKNKEEKIVNLVTIAELNKNKNYPLILDALNLLSKDLNWKYHIIGEGAEKENIAKQIAEYKLGNRVFLHGHVMEANKYLKNFNVFILGSITEALGYVLLEAGLAKLSCVATNVGGIPEIIDDGVNGFLVNLNEPEVMSKYISNLIQNQDLRKEIGEQLYLKVLNNFKKSDSIQKTENIYKTLM